MDKYEVMFITTPNEKEYEQTRDEYTKFIKDNNGNVDKIEEWGKKHLAYEIRGLYEGFYCLIKFSANLNCVKKLNTKMIQDMNNYKPIMRFMIIKKD